MTDKEKEDLKQMLQVGMIDQAYYDKMTGEVPMSVPSVTQEIAAEAESPPAALLPVQNTAPPLPAMEEWYIAIDGKQQGPHAKAKLGEMLAANEITRQTLVWKKGMAEWALIETVAELKDIFARLPPPLPPIAALATETIAPAASYNEIVAPSSIEDRYQEVMDLYDKKNYDAAILLLELLANEGYTPAQVKLGVCYECGYGVPKDPVKAVEWYRKLAEQGDAAAQNNLGRCYRDGTGVSKDPVKAVEWYRKAAEQGHADAQNNLGRCYRDGRGASQDYAKAAEWFRKAAEQGHADAQYNLGYCYTFGKGVSEDPAKATEWYGKAAEWYRKAAEQGDAAAQYNLGFCYENGKGVSQDYAKAVDWYRKAAEQGNASAQSNLGLCYNNGKGVSQDYAKAAEWYRKVAEQGDASAQHTLGTYYEKGYGVIKDRAKAIEWYRKAAEQGHRRAKTDLLWLESGNADQNDFGTIPKYIKKRESLRPLRRLP